MEREACLGAGTIVELLERKSDAAARARIDAHAARCAACRGELSALARGHAGVESPGGMIQRATTEDGRFGRYELLGAGGMGVVFAAYDAELARTVAVKVLQPGLGTEMADRLRREAQAMARLAHRTSSRSMTSGSITAVLGRALYDAGHDRARARALIASWWRALAHAELMTDERDHLAAWMAARGLR